MRGPDGATGRGDLARGIGFDLREAARVRAGSRASDPKGRERLRADRARRMELSHAESFAGSSGAAARFVLRELYPAAVPAWRDERAARALPSLAALLPEPALLALAWAARLDALREALDARELGLPGARAERIGTESDALDALEGAGRALREAARLPLAAQALRAMALPARLAGLSDLQGFLERGLAAWSALPDPDAFLKRALVIEREWQARPLPVDSGASENPAEGLGPV